MFNLNFFKDKVKTNFAANKINNLPKQLQKNILT